MAEVQLNIAIVIIPYTRTSVSISGDDRHEIGMIATGTVLFNLPQPPEDIQTILDELRVYDRNNERFLDLKKNLREENISNGSLLVVTNISDKNILNAGTRF